MLMRDVHRKVEASNVPIEFHVHCKSPQITPLPHLHACAVALDGPHRALNRKLAHPGLIVQHVADIGGVNENQKCRGYLVGALGLNVTGLLAAVAHTLVGALGRALAANMANLAAC